MAITDLEMKMSQWKVPLGDARVRDEDLGLLCDVYRSGWLSMGPRTQELESAIEAYTGAAHAVAVSSCSAGLHLACAAAGLGPGDRVVLPSNTFVATANAVAACGAEPVFAEIAGPREPWLSADAAAELVDERTRAIFAVCYGGHPGEIDRLRDLADERGLILLEDAAHGCGAWSGSRHVGTFGLAGALSFSSAKNVGVGEGGMVLTDDPGLAERLERLRWHGVSKSSWARHRDAVSAYDVAELGFNYRMDDPRAALALARLHRLEAETRQRAEIEAAYRRDLERVEGIEPTALAGSNQRSSHLMFTVTLAEGIDRDRFRRKLAERGVQTSLHFLPLHRLSLYSRPELELPLTESYSARAVTLPLFPRLEEWQRELVVESAVEAIPEAGARPAGARSRSRAPQP
jgi:dTDP-4-amino-4,6-dideoxygalactose transaminase